MKTPNAKRAGSSAVRDFRRSLRALEREVELSLLSQTDCCGVTSAQCHILLEIEARGSSSIGELAEALELDPSTMSRTADALVRAGFVTRADDPANRRRQLLDLTGTGRAKADYINAVCDEYYAAVLAEAERNRRNSLAEDVACLAAAIHAKRLEGASCCPQGGKAEKE
jgi:DNA-binding MarR family transcriptional regulator